MSICQVLDVGEYEFLIIPAASCNNSDRNYPTKTVCTYADPLTLKTKKFVQSVGESSKSIDYTKWSEC